jgi:hypothetical protein
MKVTQYKLEEFLQAHKGNKLICNIACAMVWAHKEYTCTIGSQLVRVIDNDYSVMESLIKRRQNESI